MPRILFMFNIVNMANTYINTNTNYKLVLQISMKIDSAFSLLYELGIFYTSVFKGRHSKEKVNFKSN